MAIQQHNGEPSNPNLQTGRSALYSIGDDDFYSLQFSEQLQSLNKAVDTTTDGLIIRVYRSNRMVFIIARGRS
jgi:hypothetical protein